LACARDALLGDDLDGASTLAGTDFPRMAARVRNVAPGQDPAFRLYLDEVGRHPLLTKEDEIELSQAYEAGLPGLTIAGAAA
jgi:hypothetical protein